MGIYKKTKYRITEYILRPGEKVFIHGVPIKKKNELVLCEKSNQQPLIISHKTRDKYVKDFYRGSNLVYLSYLLIAIGYLASLGSLEYLMKFNTKIFLTMGLAGLLVLLFALFSSVYNRIVTLRERANNALSNIKIELKRRSNLVPNLINVVKKYS